MGRFPAGDGRLFPTHFRMVVVVHQTPDVAAFILPTDSSDLLQRLDLRTCVTQKSETSTNAATSGVLDPDTENHRTPVEMAEAREERAAIPCNVINAFC
jgi:hypothetical protein